MIATLPARPAKSAFSPAGSRPASTLFEYVAAAAREPDAAELDARTPAPPKIVPAILAALKATPPGRPQFVRTAGAPVELLRALEAKGVEAYPTEMPDGSWRTLLILGVAGGT